MDLSDGIALAALALSAWSIWLQTRRSGRANFTAEFNVPGIISVVNHGPGVATKVTAALMLHQPEPPPADGSPPPPAGETRKEAEIKLAALGALQGHPIRFRRPMGWAPQHLEVWWTDNRLRRQHAIIELPSPPHGDPRSNDKLEAAVQAVAEKVAERVFETKINAAVRRPR